MAGTSGWLSNLVLCFLTFSTKQGRVVKPEDGTQTTPAKMELVGQPRERLVWTTPTIVAVELGATEGGSDNIEESNDGVLFS